MPSTLANFHAVSCLVMSRKGKRPERGPGPDDPGIVRVVHRALLRHSPPGAAHLPTTESPDPVCGRTAVATIGRDRGQVRRSFPRSVLVFMGFALAAALWTLPVWGHPTTTWLGAPGNSVAAMWFLGWWPFAVSHLLNPLSTTRLEYPGGVNLAWNPSAPVLGLVSWPAGVIGGVILQYNVVMTLGLAADAWAGYLACAHWVRRRRWAVLGGLLFGMSPWIMGQAYVHPSLAIAPGVPLMLVALDEAWRGRRWTVWRAGLAIAGAGCLTLLISEEVFASLSLMSWWWAFGPASALAGRGRVG